MGTSRETDIVAFIQELVRIPSRGGVDTYDSVIARVERWLGDHGIPNRRLEDPTEGSVGLYALVQGRTMELLYAINATLDTAGFGDESQWTVPALVRRLMVSAATNTTSTLDHVHVVAVSVLAVLIVWVTWSLLPRLRSLERYLRRRAS